MTVMLPKGLTIKIEPYVLNNLRNIQLSVLDVINQQGPYLLTGDGAYFMPPNVKKLFNLQCRIEKIESEHYTVCAIKNSKNNKNIRKE